MTRRLLALPLLALAATVVLAGCGGGGSSSSSTKTAATPSTTVPANLKQAVSECHHLVETQKALSATAKEKLSAACDKAGQGDTQAVKDAAREVCEEVVGKTSLPASAKETALKACKK
jgi:hypothetical protein